MQDHWQQSCFLESGCRSGSPEPFSDFSLGQSGEGGTQIGGEYLLIQLSKGYGGGGPKAWVGLLVGIDRAQQVPGEGVTCVVDPSFLLLVPVPGGWSWSLAHMWSPHMSRGVSADGQGCVWPFKLFGLSPSTSTCTADCWAGPGVVLMLMSQYDRCRFPVIECPQSE